MKSISEMTKVEKRFFKKYGTLDGMPEDYTGKFTVVRHSGYVFGGRTEFKFGLQETSINTRVELNNIRNEGGFVFNSYKEADSFCYSESYRESDKVSLRPMVDGKFSRKKIRGLNIYIN